MRHEAFMPVRCRLAELRSTQEGSKMGVLHACAGAEGAGPPNRSSKDPPPLGAGPPFARPPPPSMSNALGAAADCVISMDML